jgi:23S rRNA (uracil1939-C5)-methyltransferase
MPNITATIQDIAFGGDGVARHEGKVIFVPGTIQGESVEMQLVTESKNFSRALPVKILEPSPDRIESDCPYSLKPGTKGTADFCPGCCYRHMSYKAEVVAKTKQLEDLLKRLGKLESIPEISTLAASQPARYRNKIVFHLTPKGNLGYYGADNSSVLDIKDCMLANSHIAEEIAAFRSQPDISLPKKEAFDVTFRYTPTDGVNVWRGTPPKTPLLKDEAPVGQLLTPPSSFAQVNPDVCAGLVKHIQDLITQTKPEEFIDLYCGTGLFAIAAAQAGVDSVFGVELNEASVDCAQENAKTICPGHANFICSPSVKGLGIVADGIGNLSKSVILVDPPRKGLDKSLVFMLKNEKPLALIYVSCSPDKLARDIRELATAGYELGSLALFDMFPRTASFETVALLTKKN